jgi:hypothetical protein
MLPQSEFDDLRADLADDALLMPRNESVNGESTASGVDGTELPAQSALILGETIMELPNEPGDDDLSLSGC